MIGVRLEFIVEGPGEAGAVPLLAERWMRRKQATAWSTHAWTIDTVIAHTCDRIKHPFDPARPGLGVEWHVRTAVAKGADAIIVIVDADDDCPAALGAALVERARRTAAHVPCGVVVANREYEAWFLADMWSLRAAGAFPRENRLERLFPPESPRGAKGYVAELLGRKYLETVDQKALTAQLSMNAGLRRRSRSFRKLEWELARITREARRRAHTR